MNDLKIFGDTLPNVSDELFNNANVKYVSLFHKTKDYFTKLPETTGEITFVTNNLEGKRKFEGKNIFDVISQMQEFLKTLE